MAHRKQKKKTCTTLSLKESSTGGNKMRTYQELSDEVKDLEARQREITQGEKEPTDDQKKELWQLDGEISALNREKEIAHVAEVTTVKQAKEIKEAKAEDRFELLRTMPKNSEMAIQFSRDMNYHKHGTPGKMREARAALSTDTTPGSVLVPEEWHATVESYRFERNFVRSQGADVITTSTTHNIPVLTALSSPAIVGENTAYTDSEPRPTSYRIRSTYPRNF